MSDGVASPSGLLLGAGASFELGMPLVWDLTAEIRTWLTPEKLRSLNEGWKLQREGHGEAEIAFLSEKLLDDRLHYESILGSLETAYMRPENRSSTYHGLYSWLVELVYHLLYYRQVNNLGYIETGLRLFEGIAGLAAQHEPLWIFSLNHDLMIECLATKYELPVHSGFDEHVTFPRRNGSGTVIGELDAELLRSEKFAASGLQYPMLPERGINLLKLHGSLDVFTTNDGKDLVKIGACGAGVAGVLDGLRFANEQLIYVEPRAPGGRFKALNEIAYADAEGEMQFLRRSLLAGAYKFAGRGFQVLPEAMLGQFQHRLNWVKHLACVGYGFGDLHVNAALRNWLERSGDRRLTVVGPGTTSCPPFLLHTIEQVTLVDSVASDYFAQFAFTPLTKFEQLCLLVIRKEARKIAQRKKGYA